MATPAVETEPRGVYRARDDILRWTEKVVADYAATRHGWNPVSSLSALLRQMKREYADRFLYELIQNAYDAHPPDADGEILVLLDADEGDNGVLYVGNGGRPFTRDNFAAICSLAQSDKPPDQAIGNKGVGFKSVLQVCTWPEIYSRAAPSSEDFDGFCFGFARPADLLRLAQGDKELAAAMGKDVAPYFLAVPIDEVPERVAILGQRPELVTVIRLPLASEEARDTALSRLERLTSDSVPLHLFLPRLRRLDIVTRSCDEETCIRLDRDALEVDAPGGDPAQRYEIVDLGPQGEWFVAHRRMTAAAMRRAIGKSDLDASWKDWSEDAWVSVAVRRDGADVDPRLYAYLPMEGAAVAPLHGHLHAPFATKVARTEADEAVPLNRTLLDEAARAATSAVLVFADAPDVLPAPALADVLAWDEAHHERVTASFAAVDVDMASARVVPIRALSDGRQRGAFADTYRWPHECRLINTDVLACDVAVEIVDPELGYQRLERLERYCGAFFNTGFEAQPNCLGEWVEGVAEALLRRRASPRLWETFYDDVAVVFADAPEALAGRNILLGDDGALHSPPADADDPDQPLVFFPPAPERTEDDEEVEGDFELKPPASLQKRLVLLNDSLAWNRQEGRSRRATPARRFLEHNRLVRRFRRADLLEHLGRALARSQSKALAADALGFAFRLFASARSVDPEDLDAAGLRVPCRDGRWRPARQALFSAGWDTPLSGLLEDLIERAGPSSAELGALGNRLLLAPGDGPFAAQHAARWREFLGVLGVQDGLPLLELRDSTEPVIGDALDPDRLAGRLGLDDATAEAWASDVRATSHWRAYHPMTNYTAAEPLHALPGQADHATLDDPAKSVWARLVVAGLDRWGEGILDVEWARRSRKHRSSPDYRRWPSPLGTFLGHARWMPVTDPGDRRDERFVTPSEAWFFSERDGDRAPTFSSLVSARVRRQLSDTARALGALKHLGLDDWTDPKAAPRLLAHLASILAEGELPASATWTFRNALQDAWRRAAGWTTDDFAEAMDGVPLVVTKGEHLEVLHPADLADAALHVVGSSRSFATRVLDISEVPLVRVADADVTRAAELLSAVVGRTVPTADNVDVKIVVDGEPYAPTPDQPRLVDSNPQWFRDLIQLVLELKPSRFDTSSARRRAEIIDRLQAVRVRHAASILLGVGTLEVISGTEHDDVVPLDDLSAPTLITTIPASEGLLVALLPRLCELLGIIDYEDTIGRALEHLENSAATDPTEYDLAEALRVDIVRVREILSHLATHVDTLLDLVAPVVVYERGIDAGLHLLEERGQLEDEASLADRLAGLMDDPVGAEELLDAARSVSTHAELLERLNLDFARFNAALKGLSGVFAPIHNQRGHEHALRHHVEARSEELLERLRRRFLSAYRQGGSLAEYVDARRLAVPGPASEWLDLYDLPPYGVLDHYVERWIDTFGDSPVEGPLDAVGLLRIANRSVVAEVAGRALLVVPAWARKNAVSVPTIWSADDAVESLTEEAVEGGVLDFERVDEAATIRLLSRAGHWPPAMSETLDLEVLGLAPGDLRVAQDRDEEARREKEARSRRVEMDGRQFSARKDHFGDLAEYVRSHLRPDVLDTSLRVTKLAELSKVPVREDASGGGGGRRSVKGQRLSREQTETIGRIGETIAYEWLKEKYGELCGPSSWRSANCDTIGQPNGDDHLGYDFEIVLKSRTVFFEVKATKGTDMSFELGESEVVKARDCARSKRCEYRILFITEALDTERQEIHVLPNPMDPEHQRFYRFPGSGLTCSFRLVA